jgi:alginate O-acetyltransferase complex protein AlgI
LEHEGNFNRINRWNGLKLIALGYFKKLVIADNLAPLVNAAFVAPDQSLGGAAWWLAGFTFGGQIYCDFSGYSDIACGTALWMGYAFIPNFRHPYLAVGFRDFWSRWHISLSTWFRDYVFIPLGGSRCKPLRNAANLWCTMLSSGLWHGANWTFLIWGAMHASFLSCERLIGNRCFGSGSGLLRIVGWIVTLACVSLSWIPFRANSTSQLFGIWHEMFWSIQSTDGIARLVTPSVALGIICLIGIEASHAALVRLQKHNRNPAWFPKPSIAGTCFITVALLCSIFLRGPGSDFIYFAF